MFKKITIEQLAMMVANGFQDITDKMGDMATKTDLTILEARLNNRIENLELGQENIQLRLDQMAPNFELKNLRKRVTRIENHLKLT